MGNDYEGQEAAIRFIKEEMPEAVKKLLGHHLNTSMTGILCGLQLEDKNMTLTCAKHLAADLKRFGL